LAALPEFPWFVSLCAFHAQELLQLGKETKTDPFLAVYMTELVLLYASRCFEENRHEMHLWLFLTALLSLVKLLPAKHLAGDEMDALAYIQAMMPLWENLPVDFGRFQAEVGGLDKSRYSWSGLVAIRRDFTAVAIGYVSRSSFRVGKSRGLQPLRYQAPLDPRLGLPSVRRAGRRRSTTLRRLHRR